MEQEVCGMGGSPSIRAATKRWECRGVLLALGCGSAQELVRRELVVEGWQCGCGWSGAQEESERWGQGRQGGSAI